MFHASRGTVLCPLQSQQPRLAAPGDHFEGKKRLPLGKFARITNQSLDYSEQSFVLPPHRLLCDQSIDLIAVKKKVGIQGWRLLAS